MAVLTAYGVWIEIALGIGRADLLGRWDTALWDQSVWGLADDTSLGDWVDVTCDTVDPLTLQAGSSDAEGVVTRWESATCTLTLIGETWNPWSGPYAGLLGPGMPVRVRWRLDLDGAEWNHAFNGRVDDDGYNFEPTRAGRIASAVIAAVDGTAQLAQYDAPGLAAPVGSGEQSWQRVGRILDWAHWPSDLRSVFGGGQTVKETDLSGPAWTQLLLVSDSDLALSYVGRGGIFFYDPLGRTHPGVPSSYRLVSTCKVEPHDIVLVDMTRAQPSATRNIVSISRAVNAGAPDAPVVTVTDDQSIARFGARAYTRDDLVHTSDAWSATIAQTVLGSSAWFTRAPRTATMSSLTEPPAPESFLPLLLLGVEPSVVLIVDDGVEQWRETVVGWSVTVGPQVVQGTLVLDDLTRWAGSQWDTGQWDEASWGV